MIVRALLDVVALLACRSVGAWAEESSSTSWVIEQESEIISVSDLASFLEIAQLKEHKGVLDTEGIILDDIAEMTDELLQDLGITKKMQRKRFLRYAKLMRPHAGAAKSEPGKAAECVEEEAVREKTAPKQPWVLTKDNGEGKEVVFVPDLETFLEVLPPRVFAQS